MPQEELKLSQFNDAVSQIGRLNEIWNESRRLREKGRLLPWKFKLHSASIELKYDAKQLGGDYVNNIQKLDKDILSTELLLLTAQNELRRLIYNKRLYEFLTLKEELLREIQEQAGKGGKYLDPDEDGM